MIVQLEGELIEASPLEAVVSVGGIGYAVHIPVTTAEKLPPLGQKVNLYTLAVYREDSATLYGFHSREDRDFFQLLVEKVSGIGPKIALSILSRLSVPVLRQAIAHADVTLLSKCQGIGKKTAERLVVELRDKMYPGVTGSSAVSGAALDSTAAADSGDSILRDAVAALVTLGFKPADADKAVRIAREKLGPETTTESLIRHALR